MKVSKNTRKANGIFQGRSNIHSATSFLNSELTNLKLVTEANGYPIWLLGTPLQIIDFSVCVVSQDRVGYLFLWDARKVPNECLRIITSCTKMTSRMRSPRRGIDTTLMTSDLSNRGAGKTNIQDLGLQRVHLKCCQVVGVLLIPFQPEKWFQLFGFIDDRRMLQRSQIEHSN